MAQELLDFIKRIDIKSQTRENHTSNCIDKYEQVTEGNYKELCLLAIEQYEILFSYENQSVFYIEDWRINFNNLKLLVENCINKGSILLIVKLLLKYYDTSEKSFMTV